MRGCGELGGKVYLDIMRGGREVVLGAVVVIAHLLHSPDTIGSVCHALWLVFLVPQLPRRGPSQL